jgi:histone acetyltransferase MYST1
LQKLYFAEYDLMFFKNRQQMLRHLRKTKLQHPPGDEIYRNGNVSMFEIDGRKERMYCQVLRAVLNAAHHAELSYKDFNSP